MQLLLFCLTLPWVALFWPIFWQPITFSKIKSASIEISYKKNLKEMKYWDRMILYIMQNEWNCYMSIINWSPFYCATRYITLIQHIYLTHTFHTCIWHIHPTHTSRTYISQSQSCVAFLYQNLALKSSLQEMKAGPVGEWAMNWTTPLCPVGVRIDEHRWLVYLWIVWRWDTFWYLDL